MLPQTQLWTDFRKILNLFYDNRWNLDPYLWSRNRKNNLRNGHTVIPVLKEVQDVKVMKEDVNIFVFWVKKGILVFDYLESVTIMAKHYVNFSKNWKINWSGIFKASVENNVSSSHSSNNQQKLTDLCVFKFWNGQIFHLISIFQITNSKKPNL